MIIASRIVGRVSRLPPLPLLPLAAAAAVLMSAGAGAETSSWLFRDPKPLPEKTASPQGASPHSSGAGTGLGDHGSTHRKGPKPAAKPDGGVTTPGAAPRAEPAPEKDDAYLAFDQGRYLTALKLAEDLAKRGDALAHTLVARIHAEGLGVPKDEALAASWYKRAAELGDVNAAFAYGVMLAEGRGIEKNRAAAAEMFERAARTGHAAANYNLGLLFLKGDGKPENPIRAAQHIAYAAEKGIAAAQYDLATLYQSGVGVPHDAVETSRWLRAAADQGMPAAQYEYAVLLLRGLGLRADEPKAVDYLTGAAEKNVAGAQNRLAYVYHEGIGVDKSDVEAAKWRIIAKANGFGEDKTMDDLVAGLKKGDREKAEAAARAWQAKRLQF